jgi:hypothetical protein
MALALVGHVGFVLAFYFSALTLWTAGQQVPRWQDHFLIVPIGMVIQAMPLFPGGAGIGELGFGGLYQLLGCPAAGGILGSLVQRVLVWVIGLAGYLVYLRLRPRVAGSGQKAAGGQETNQAEWADGSATQAGVVPQAGTSLP